MERYLLCTVNEEYRIDAVTITDVSRQREVRSNDLGKVVFELALLCEAATVNQQLVYYQYIYM